MANPTVKTLAKDQITVPLGQKLFPKGSPNLEITQTGTKEYKIILSMTMIVLDENLTATPKSLPDVGSLAVLNISSTQALDPAKSNIYIQTIQNGASDDFTLNMSMGIELPGSKGNHGS